MSKFKKMKLVPLEENSQENLLGDVLNVIKLYTSPELKKASFLDKDIKIILNSNIDDFQKVKLYGQALKKFLIYKEKYQTEKYDKDEDASRKSIVATTPIKTKKKKLKKLKGNIILSNLIKQIKSGYKKPKYLKAPKVSSQSIYQTPKQSLSQSQQNQSSSSNSDTSLLRYFHPSMQQSSSPLQSIPFHSAQQSNVSPLQQMRLQPRAQSPQRLIFKQEEIEQFVPIARSRKRKTPPPPRKQKPRQAKTEALLKVRDDNDDENEWEQF